MKKPLDIYIFVTFAIFMMMAYAIIFNNLITQPRLDQQRDEAICSYHPVNCKDYISMKPKTQEKSDNSKLDEILIELRAIREELNDE